MSKNRSTLCWYFLNALWTTLTTVGLEIVSKDEEFTPSGVAAACCRCLRLQWRPFPLPAAPLPLSKGWKSNSNVYGSNFNNVDGHHLLFMDANVSRASFRGADLFRSSFVEVNAQHADFCGANLRQIQAGKGDFTGATYDSATQFCDRLNPVAAGMIYVDTTD